LVARGLEAEPNNRYTAFDPICLDFDPDAVGGSDLKWNSLIGADVQILIDGQAMTGAYVSGDGRLSRKDGKKNYDDPESSLFQYCLLLWQNGLHTLTIRIPQGVSDKTDYSWAVYGETSANCGNNQIENDCLGT
ncbi:MAG TPA: hypothetical protein VKQ72_07160, partial [Aggregatilineales bacterium]|nr:hypothetical protein [Aggregatilineales bacterium]